VAKTVNTNYGPIMKNNIEKMDFSTVLASSVHDMKNSLAMLLGSLADISSECQGGNCSIKNELSRIRHEGQRVNRDLIQLLTLYKIDQSQYYLNIGEINIYDYLDEIVLEYRYLLNERGVDISLQCDVSLSGFFDAELVSGVLKTIINNAYQYTHNKILVSAESTGDFIKLSITDNGKGYPPHMLFDKSIHKTTSNFDTGSTGLGLYFSSQVAKLHKNKKKCGYIQIKNISHSDTKLKGGCFSIFLP